MTQEQKDEELYKASLEAFFNNELETDKMILGLSVAAIGFYMALFLNKDFIVTEIMFITIIIALFSFLIVSAMTLLIFIRNKKQLIHIIATTGNAGEDFILDFLDKWKYLPFIIGVIASIIFTLSLTFTKINNKGDNMAENKNQSVYTKDGVSGVANANQRNHQAGISRLQDANKTPPPPPPPPSSNSGSKNGQ